MLRPLLAKVVEGEDLGRREAREAMTAIMSGEASDSWIAGFVIALRAKGETVDEIAGCAEAMREAAVTVEVGGDGLVDTCGTGGDGARTFNISTGAALVAAGAGVEVAKHGNRAVSSSCGSADVLEQLGVTLTADPEVHRRCLREAGITFLFAPHQHPAMRHAAGPRGELGLRTVFNLLGPLTNPAGASRQLVGVYDPRLVPVVARVLGELGAERAMVVHGAGGMDEISTLGATEVAEWVDGEIRRTTIEPEELGLERARPEEIRGRYPAANADLLRRVLEGEPGAAREIVLLNAAAAIQVAGRVDGLAEGLEAAAAAVDEGRAAEALDALIRASSAGESEGMPQGSTEEMSEGAPEGSG